MHDSTDATLKQAGALWPVETCSPVLAPGRTCWRIARAHRAAFLIDGAAYFAALEAALRRARRSIMILAWDFDSRINLDPRAPGAPPLGAFLRALAEARPELEIRVLVWGFSLVYSRGSDRSLLRGRRGGGANIWRRHPRVRVKLDVQHPFGASHHQKLVVVDDAVAFVGGIDPSRGRWDTPAHAAAGAMWRREPNGAPRGPRHDVMMAVDGAAARTLGELARRRWRAATDEALRPPEAAGDPWPPALTADVEDVPVGIARTEPALVGGDGGRSGRGSAREAAALILAALRAARRWIYIEAQYVTAPVVAEVLAARLAEPNGPEVVLVTTHSSRGVLERFVMGGNRDRLLRRLKRADCRGRLRAFYPVVLGGPPEAETDAAPEEEVLVHSKLVLVDDTFLRIGSSNLNNRSLGLDTECDLALEAGPAHNQRTRRAITRLLARLVGEHVGAAPSDVLDALTEAGGSLIAAIERLNGDAAPRRLVEFAIDPSGPTGPVLGTALLDPAGPIGIQRRLGDRDRRTHAVAVNTDPTTSARAAQDQAPH